MEGEFTIATVTYQIIMSEFAVTELTRSLAIVTNESLCCLAFLKSGTEFIEIDTCLH
jgi:hypothetical protein